MSSSCPGPVQVHSLSVALSDYGSPKPGANNNFALSPPTTIKMTFSTIYIFEEDLEGRLEANLGNLLVLFSQPADQSNLKVIKRRMLEPLADSLLQHPEKYSLIARFKIGLKIKQLNWEYIFKTFYYFLIMFT